MLPETLPADVPPARPPAGPSASERRSWRRWGLVAGVGGVAFILAAQVISRTLGGGGSYEFIAEQGDYPVTWNHCQAIRYQVNPKGAPEGWDEIVHKAVADIAENSGFVFADRGTTAKTKIFGARYDGTEWEPVLIVWTDRYQDQMLEGNTIGLGGSGVTPDAHGIPRFVVGQVRLDTNVRDPKQTQLVLEHELGHVLGLDHVDDSSQLMYPAYHGQDGLGRGDINGLKKLHDVPCS